MSMYHLQRAKKILRNNNQKIEKVGRYKYIVIDQDDKNKLYFIKDDDELIKFTKTAYE